MRKKADLVPNKGIDLNRFHPKKREKKINFIHACKCGKLNALKFRKDTLENLSPKTPNK